MSDEVEEQYRLSDGRDVREVAQAIEAVAQRQRTADTRIPPVDAVISLVGAGAVHVKLATLMKNAPDGDLEILLRVSNERGWTQPRLPGTPLAPLEAEQLFLRNYLEHGDDLVASGANAFRIFYRGLEGRAQDTRDPDAIADEFLQRVHSLAAFGGEEAIAAHIDRARRDVLDGVSDKMRSRVLEKILDREERGALSAEAADALRQDREGRQERGWRALMERATTPATRERGR